MKTKLTDYSIKTVNNALALLEEFQLSCGELGVTDLSKRLNLPKNNIFRLLSTLAVHNYIEQNESTGKYQLGVKIIELGQIALNKNSLTKHTQPVLRKLNKLSNETCYFSILKQNTTFFIDGVESELPVRVVHRMGTRQPIHCTAAGKVQVAFLNKKDGKNIIMMNPLTKYTEFTITDPSDFQTELQEILSNGYALENQEFEDGVLGIAAPVIDYKSTIVGAVSLSAPISRISANRIKNEFVPLVMQSAMELSGRLGYAC